MRARVGIPGILGVAGVLAALAVLVALGVIRPAIFPGAAPAPAQPPATSDLPVAQEPGSSAGVPSPSPPKDPSLLVPPVPSGSADLPAVPQAGSDQVPAADPLDASGPGTDWWAVLGVLDQRRHRALTDRDPSQLSRYLVPGSPAWSADSELIAELRGQGVRPVGLVTDLIAIEGVEVGSADPVAGHRSGSEAETSPEPGSGPDAEVDGTGETPSNGTVLAHDRATIVLVDQRSGYTLVDASGVVVQVVDSPGTQRWEVALARTGEEPEGSDGGWRVSEVTPLP